MKNILDFTHDEARAYFLKQERYTGFDLQPYFNFKNLLHKISDIIDGSRLSDFYDSELNDKGKNKPTKPDKYEDVNYHFLVNKDGRYAWRPFQLIHPAIYVSLVHSTTEEDKWNEIVTRFQIFQNNPKIRCESLPVESDKDENYASNKTASVMWWLSKVERESIKLSLDYQYVHHTYRLLWCNSFDSLGITYKAYIK